MACSGLARRGKARYGFLTSQVQPGMARRDRAWLGDAWRGKDFTTSQERQGLDWFGTAVQGLARLGSVWIFNQSIQAGPGVAWRVQEWLGEDF